MDERTLLILASLLAFIGISLIVYASPRVEPPYYPIGEIKPALVGEVVASSGILIRESETSGVRILTLYDNVTIIVPLFGMDEHPEIGDRVRLAGTVKIYKGSMELIPVMGRIAIENPAPIPVMISDITPGMKYKVVEVSGVAGRVVSVTNGYLFDMDDGTGEITIASFGREIDVTEGDFLTVEGMVNLYKGKLELMYRSSRT